MTINGRDLVRIQHRAKASGVPMRIVVPIVNTFLLWEKNNGLEWAISRFKAIKNDMVRIAAGLKPVATWVKTSRSGRTHFGGDIGVLEGWMAKETHNLAPTLALLNIYTSFYSPSPTGKQKRKFLAAVHAPVVMVSDAAKRAVLRGLAISGIRKKRKLAPAPPLLAYNPSVSKWAPTPFGRKTEEAGVVDSVGYLASVAGNSHYLRYKEYYSPVLAGLESEITLGHIFVPSTNPLSAPVAGRIGLIQEAGFKLRAVANPGRVFQQVLSPLGNELFKTLKGLPWDCTFDQSKADPVLLGSTEKQMKTIHSVDLSNATDFFPLDLQLEVLYALFPRDLGLVDLFQEVSRFSWECNLPQVDLTEFGFSEPGKIRWHVGQPLGLYPSFASFALTHGLLLLGLLGRPWNEEFFILGDDVVILDDELYTRYIQILDELGCPVSLEKTLSSPKLCEFHSTVFFRGKKIPAVKWRNPSDDSFLDILRVGGPELVSMLTPRQREVAKALGPLPEFLGGLGWNPKGLSLDERITPWMSYLLRDKPSLEHLTDYNGAIRKLLYMSDLSSLTRKVGLSLESDVTYFETFDLKVISIVRRTLGISLVPMRAILGQNLSEVLDVVDLPIPGVRDLKHSSSLEKWERIIKYSLQVPESQ